MDIGNILAPRKPKWHRLEPHDAEFLIVELTPDDVDRITHKTAGRFGREDKVQWHKRTMIAAVKGWRNLYHEGKEFPFTPENLESLDKKWADFRQFWQEVALSEAQDALAEAKAEKEEDKEEAVKN